MLVTLAASLIACGPAPTVVDRQGQPAVLVYPPADDSMDLAIADARRSVASFVSELPRLQADGAYVSVKAPIPTAGDTEHIWLSALVYREGVFYGELGNEPIAEELTLGDPYSVRSSEISDWMAVSEGQLFGGYTIFVARDQLDEAQRRDFEATLGIRMPETPQAFR